MALDIVIGIGIVAFFISFIAFQLKGEDDDLVYVFKIFMILVAFLIIGLIPKVTYDNCSIVQVNMTTPAAGDEVYSYDEICVGSDKTTGFSFWKIIYYFYRYLMFFSFMLLMLFIVYTLFNVFKNNKNKRRKGGII